jgi:hypothetical protein
VLYDGDVCLGGGIIDDADDVRLVLDQQRHAVGAGMGLANHVIAAVDQHRVEQATGNGAGIDNDRF